jgi:hypothetical protein
MKRISVILIALVCALAAFGQTTSTTTGASTLTTGSTGTNAAATEAEPSSWFVGSGVELNPYSKTYGTPAYQPFVHVGGCWTSFRELPASLHDVARGELIWSVLRRRTDDATTNPCRTI